MKSGNNIGLMQKIITQFYNSIHNAYPFYYYIGSAALWRQHLDMLKRMQETIKQVRINMIKKNEDNNKLTFDPSYPTVEPNLTHTTDDLR